MYKFFQDLERMRCVTFFHQLPEFSSICCASRASCIRFRFLLGEVSSETLVARPTTTMTTGSLFLFFADPEADDAHLQRVNQYCVCGLFVDANHDLMKCWLGPGPIHPSGDSDWVVCTWTLSSTTRMLEGKQSLVINFLNNIAIELFLFRFPL